MTTFQEAINKAAELTDHRITDNDRAVAASGTGVEKMKALRLLADARIQSATRQVMADIKGAHPEASSLLLSGRTNVGLKPPKELSDHLASIIGRVLTEPDAQSITYSTWTGELNKAFGNRFNPGTFFSKKQLGKQLRARLNSTFEARGLAPLPESCETLAQAMKTAKAARLGKQENANLFAGGVGRIVGSQLVIGHNTFAIKPHGGHDCIRVPRGDGSSGRIRLADFERGLMGSGLGFGGGSTSSLSTSTCRVGDQGKRERIAATDPTTGELGQHLPDSSPISTDELERALALPQLAPPVLVPELADRIANLRGSAEQRAQEHARAAELAAMKASRTDPLESV